MAQGQSGDGFTLIEVMIVAAVLGILAAVAIPKFSNMHVKAREATVKSSLTALRGAISIYYADNGSLFPSDGEALIPKYMTSHSVLIPLPADHGRRDEFTRTDDDWTTGAWIYVSADGHVAVNCTHRDTKGSVWSQY